MSREQERIKKLERYYTDLNADFGRLHKHNALMQSEFEQKLNEMSVDFKVKIKKHIHEVEKLQEATVLCPCPDELLTFFLTVLSSNVIFGWSML
jgi:hypothetical protein